MKRLKSYVFQFDLDTLNQFITTIKAPDVESAWEIAKQEAAKYPLNIEEHNAKKPKFLETVEPEINFQEYCLNEKLARKEKSLLQKQS